MNTPHNSHKQFLMPFYGASIENNIFISYIKIMKRPFLYFSAVTVLTFLLLVITQSCGIPYNPSFARNGTARDSRAPASNGYGTFSWNITFPSDTIIADRCSLILKYQPESENELNFEDDYWQNAVTSGSATGSQDMIPAGTYFLNLYLGAEFSYVARSEIIVIKKDEIKVFDLPPLEDADFKPYVLVRAKLKVTSYAGISGGTALRPVRTNVTFHTEADCSNTPVPSISAADGVMVFRTANFNAEYNEFEWFLFDNDLAGVDFYAQVIVTDSLGREYRRITGPWTLSWPEINIYITPEPLLYPLSRAAGVGSGSVSFSQFDIKGREFGSAQGYTGFDPEQNITVTAQGAAGYHLDNIKFLTAIGENPLVRPSDGEGASGIIQTGNSSFMTRFKSAAVTVEANWRLIANAKLAAELSPVREARPPDPQNADLKNYIAFRRYTTLKAAVDAAAAEHEDDVYVLDNLLANGQEAGGFSDNTGHVYINFDVNIRPKGGNWTIMRWNGFLSRFFHVNSGGKLLLGGNVQDDGNRTLTLDGNGAAVSANFELIGVSTNSTFVMEDGVVLKNNQNTSSTGGGAVIVVGTFEMKGGRIEGCVLGDANAKGAGVNVDNGSFMMSGGAVVASNNDVYLADGRTINITGDITGSQPAAVIDPERYPTGSSAGAEVLSGAALNGNFNKFKLKDDNFEIRGDGKIVQKGTVIATLIRGGGSGTLYYSSSTYNETSVLSAVIAAVNTGVNTGTALNPDKIVLVNGKTYTPNTELEIPDYRHIQIVNETAGSAVIKRGSQAIFVVRANASLTLGGGDNSKNIILDGAGASSSYPLAYTGATVSKIKIKNGAMLTGNNYYALGVNDGDVDMEGGEISGNNEGVSIKSGKTFYMSGGIIKDNIGYGVRVDGGGTFKISGGAVVASNNDVYLSNGTCLTIAEQLTGTGVVATIDPQEKSPGTPVLGGITTLITANHSRFALSNTCVASFRITTDGLLASY